MYPAFKQSLVSCQLLLALLIILSSQQSFAESEIHEDFDTTQYWHESDTQMTEKERFLVHSEKGDLSLGVFIMDTHGEPVNKPLRAEISYIYQGGKVQRLVLSEENEASNHFMCYGAPDIVDRDEFLAQFGVDPSQIPPGQTFYEAGEYFVLRIIEGVPGGAEGECDPQQEQFMVHWLDGVRDEQD